MRSHTLDMGTGRTMSWAELGADDGAVVVVHHHGTGSSRLEMAILDDELAARGIRVVAPDRPGYGESSPWTTGPRVVDWVADAAALVDHLGLDGFAVSGYSGGGPYALAMAASPTLGPRTSRVYLRASIAPGLGPRDPRDARIRDRAGTLPWDEYLAWFAADPDDVDPGMAPSDEEYFADPVRVEGAMATLAEGARQGTAGPASDLWTFSLAWGFDLAAVAQPVAIWHGDADTRVPVQHAQVLAAQLPDAKLHVVSGAGHFAIARCIDDIIDALATNPAAP